MEAGTAWRRKGTGMDCTATVHPLAWLADIGADGAAGGKQGGRGA